MNGMKSSAIRELLKLTERPEIISFAGGLPAPELFPIDAMMRVSADVLENDGKAALQYTTTEGFLPLRRFIANRMKVQHVETCEQEILITSGSQQGLDFAGRVFLDEGDVVVCERPSYLGAINAFRAYQCQFKDVPMDDDGMRMDLLEETLKTTERVKFIYAIPDFQNPTGRTMSVERRRTLVELARKYNVLILEDNPYGELRFEGEILPAIKHFDTEGRVIYLGTMSKTFCPGLRIGWVSASPDVVNRFTIAKQGADLQSSTIAQRQAAKFVENYNLDDHVQRIISVYRKRRDLMLSGMEKEFPKGIEFTRPQGGLFTWVTLPRGFNAEKILERALEQKVAFVPGASFFACGGNENTFRMNYSNMSEERIVEGVKRLGHVLRTL
jgi:DNA-binding transcriptional MocR family regulator